jgi:hypothetical protein
MRSACCEGDRASTASFILLSGQPVRALSGSQRPHRAAAVATHMITDVVALLSVLASREPSGGSARAIATARSVPMAVCRRVGVHGAL